MNNLNWLQDVFYIDENTLNGKFTIDIFLSWSITRILCIIIMYLSSPSRRTQKKNHQMNSFEQKNVYTSCSNILSWMECIFIIQENMRHDTCVYIRERYIYVLKDSFYFRWIKYYEVSRLLWLKKTISLALQKT